MKFYLVSSLFILAFMIITPAFAINHDKNSPHRANFNIAMQEIQSPKTEVASARVANSRVFRVRDNSTGALLEIPDEEFTYGAVITEMPISFCEEALKAQAVAAYTYFCRERDTNRSAKEPDEADFCVDTANWKFYTTKEQMQSRWGGNFDEYYQKLKRCVDAVLFEVVKNDDGLILAAYHAISGGNTEASVDVFGGWRDYLVPVPSPGDLFAPNYQTTVELTPAEFKESCLAKWPEISLESDANAWVSDSHRTASGTITHIKIGDVETTGREVRDAFSLRSADFDISFSGEKFVFTVRGYGHGVGMSQYGAEYMAKQGADYRQILSWYYPGTCVEKI